MGDVDKEKAENITPTKKKLVSELWRIAYQVGHRPLRCEIKQKSHYRLSAYRQYWANVTEAWETAGLPENIKQIPDSELEREIWRLYNALGYAPTSSDMKRWGNYSYQPYSDRYDGWQEALRCAGLNPDDRPNEKLYNISKPALKNALEDLYNNLGHIPCPADMDQEGEYASITYIRVFDSWGRSLVEVGVGPEEPFDKQRILKDLADLAHHTCSVPEIRDVQESASMSLKPYYVATESFEHAKELALTQNSEAATPS